jgi:hypothetical protein
MMADIELTPTTLVVHIRGADRFLALKSQLEIPLAHVAQVELNPAEAHQVWHGLRIAGANLPGVVTAGRFLQQGQWAFWDVHDPDQAICVHLLDEDYAKLVIGVDNPEATAHAIRNAARQLS